MKDFRLATSEETFHTSGLLTSHSLGYGLIFTVCSRIRWNITLVVTPHGNISEAFVELAIFEVLGRQNTNTTCRVYQVIKRYGTRTTIFRSPLSRNRSSRVSQLVSTVELVILMSLEID